MSKPSDLVQGTLDMLILKIVALEPVNGWAISQRLQQISRDVLGVSDGSLYPALHKLEQPGLDHSGVEVEWKQSSREVLFPDAARAEATGKRDGKLEPDLDGDLRHCKAQGGLSMGFQQWFYSLTVRWRDRFRRKQVDQELRERAARPP